MNATSSRDNVAQHKEWKVPSTAVPFYCFCTGLVDVLIKLTQHTHEVDHTPATRDKQNTGPSLTRGSHTSLRPRWSVEAAIAPADRLASLHHRQAQSQYPGWVSMLASFEISLMASDCLK